MDRAGLVLLAAAAGIPGLAGGSRPGTAGSRWAALAALATAGTGIAVLTAPLGPLASVGRAAATLGGLCVVAALASFDRHSPHARLAPLLVLVTAGGIYATVPDTEGARVLLSAALPCALLAWHGRGARLGGTGSQVLGGVLVWVVASGGHGRAGAVVGGLAAAGLLLADPAARAVAGRSLLDRLRPGPAAGALLVASHAGLVLAASRVAGLRATAVAAAAIALPLLAVSTALLAWWPQRRVTRSTG